MSCACATQKNVVYYLLYGVVIMCQTAAHQPSLFRAMSHGGDSQWSCPDDAEEYDDQVQL